MATDATGTPTSLGIPTYNTAVDAPSGNGFNAAMGVIDSLLAARATTASPALTGNPTAPTQAAGDDSTKIATTGFVFGAVAAVMPSGAILPYAGASAPSGFLLADGSAVSRTTYSALFAAIGTAYGAGDGSTTFNVPNLQGRVPVGKNAGTFSALGATGGEETHVLSAAEMPVHSHSISGQTATESNVHSHGITMSSTVLNFASGASALTVMTNTGSYSTGTESANHAHGVGTLANANAGSGSAHNNLQPYTVVNYIVKT